ncbi:hypothetical protein F5Y07DRAFT_394877 [Xylaria sp. FL0933]|nr:hypothetical protein F5Y07DRAFT_394877 [Xylaria sp. FL0933]
MSASIAFILCFLEAFALGAPVTAHGYPTFTPQNSTGHMPPMSSNFMLNGRIKATGVNANHNTPPPKDNSNVIIGVVLGATAGIFLILWCDGGDAGDGDGYDGGVFNNRVLASLGAYAVSRQGIRQSS